MLSDVPMACVCDFCISMVVLFFHFRFSRPETEMSELRTRLQSSQHPPGSPSHGTGAKPSQKHRKIVLVDEALHSAKSQAEKHTATTTASKSDLTSPPVEHLRKTSTASLHSDHSNSHLHLGFNSDFHLPFSPCGSARSSTSSLLGSVSNVSSLLVTPSSEHRILEELKRQIASSALRIVQLEKEVQQIPKLTSQVCELEQEKEKLGNDLLDNQEVVQTLKQRVSVLHEQNGQLAKLVQTQKGGSSEVLAMRNALVASLTQLKQLQEQVNTIPELKQQATTLSDEITVLRSEKSEITKHLPVELPEGVEPGDYKSLFEENSQLRSTNQKLVGEVKGVEQQLSSVSALCEGFKKRMENYESSQTIVGPLQERIKRLEKEKDDLYQEIIDVKLHYQASADFDTAHLSQEVAVLKKANSKLRGRMEQMKIDSRQQKEQLILKLFEMEALNVRAHKCELEKQVLALDLHSASHSQHLDRDSPDELEVEMQGAPPESKIQMIKLQELRVHTEQSKVLMQMLLSEKEELEKKVSELNERLEVKGVIDLEKRLEDAESKLSLAREKISCQERELHAAISSKTKPSLLTSENEKLRGRVAQLELACRQYSKLAETRKEMEEGIQRHDSLVRSLEKAKEDKRKSEKKYKESKEKLRLLASKLTGSVQLLNDYQVQTASLQEQLDQSRSNLKTLREEYASVKAKLEVAETEREMDHKSGASSSLAVLGEHLKLENAQSSQLHLLTKERDDLKQALESLRQKAAQERSQYQQLKSEKADLTVDNGRLQEKIKQLSDNLSKVVTEKSVLESKLRQLSTETSMSSERSAEVQAAREKIEEELKLKAAEVRTMVQNTAALKKQLDASQAVETQQAERLNILQSDLDLAEEAADKLSRQREETSKQLESCSAQVSLLQKDVAQRDAEIDNLRKELGSASHQLKQLHTQFSEVTKHFQEERKQRNLAENELMLLRTGEMEKLHSELKGACRESEKLSVDLERSRSQLKSLECSVEAKSSEVVSLKQQLAAANSNVTQELEETRSELSKSRESIASLQNQLEQLQIKHRQVESEHDRIKEVAERTEAEKNCLKVESENFKQQLGTSKTSFQSQLQSLQSEKRKLQSQLQVREQSTKACVADLEAKLKQREDEQRKLIEDQHQQKKELEHLRRTSQRLSDETEGYRATVKSLQRKIDEAETREIEHEILKQKIQRLEATLSDSSQLKHDNQALLKMLQETVRELPSFTSEANRSLQEENLRLEQQVSVLSQWNDKQRQEIEMLERRMDDMESQKHQIVIELMERENHEQENRQLKQELKEVEMEVNTLRRQVRADLHEEMQVKLETQTQLLSVFNAHNSSLQKQVEDLQSQVRTLGGNLEREKPVSPPPMPDVMLTLQSSGEMRQRTVSELGRENEILKQRITKLHGELVKVQEISASVRRRSSFMSAISSTPIAPVNEEIQIK